MLVRNLDFLSIPKEFKKIEIDIYENQNLVLVYINDKWYSLIYKIGDEIVSTFLLKTNLPPHALMEGENPTDKEDMVNVIKMLLDKIYSNSDIKEYDKMHQEHVFLKIMDLFIEDQKTEMINEDNSVMYSEIEKGFMKLEIDIMENKINFLNQAMAQLNTNFTNTVNDIQENDFGNKVRKVLDQR